MKSQIRTSSLAFLCGTLLLPQAALAEPTFVDPTARVVNGGNVVLGPLVYVGPFAELRGGTRGNRLVIEEESNVQDNVLVDATFKSIELGPKVILAHGSAVKTALRNNVAFGARLGLTLGSSAGVDPVVVSKLSLYGHPTFVSFNAEVEGATIQKCAMVSALAKIGPGVQIPSYRKVLPGVFIRSNGEVAAKTVPVTEADADFMFGVIEVNVSFAESYTHLAADAVSDGHDYLHGINLDPGHSSFNPERNLPHLAGVASQVPGFRNRIIGDVSLANDLATLNGVMGSGISLRADEGEPFLVGTITAMANNVTFHALEFSAITCGNAGRYGTRSIIHGGATPFSDPAPGANPGGGPANARVAGSPSGPVNRTVTGNGFILGDGAVFFRSRAGNNVTVGARSVVQQCDLPDGTVIPAREIWLNNVKFGNVQW